MCSVDFVIFKERVEIYIFVDRLETATVSQQSLNIDLDCSIQCFQMYVTVERFDYDMISKFPLNSDLYNV